MDHILNARANGEGIGEHVWYSTCPDIHKKKKIYDYH